MGFANAADDRGFFPDFPATRQYVKYVPAGDAVTHEPLVGYALWLVGFTGAHRFFFGQTLTGILWFFTFGLFGVGWIVDLFLIPGMGRSAGSRYLPGRFDYNLAWLLCLFLGLFGFHRFYQGKIFTGLLYLATGGLFVVGWIYDLCTLNEQIAEANALQRQAYRVRFA